MTFIVDKGDFFEIAKDKVKVNFTSADLYADDISKLYFDKYGKPDMDDYLVGNYIKQDIKDDEFIIHSFIMKNKNDKFTENTLNMAFMALRFYLTSNQIYEIYILTPINEDYIKLFLLMLYKSFSNWRGSIHLVSI